MLSIRSFSFLLVVAVIFLVGGAQAQNADTISEVVYQMTPGSMGGYDLKVVFRRDGTALYNTVRNSKKEKLQGTISTDLFDQLAKFISARNFSEFRSTLVSGAVFAGNPSAPSVNPAIIYTTVVDNGKRKTVAYPIGAKVNSPEDPPKGLLEIGTAIMRITDRISWTKANK